MTRMLALALSFLLARAAFAQQVPKADEPSKGAPAPKASQQAPANPTADQVPQKSAAAASAPPRAESSGQAHSQVHVRATMTVIDPHAGVDEIIGRLRKRELAPEHKEPARAPQRSEGSRAGPAPDRGEGVRQDQRDARAAGRDAQRVSRDARRDTRSPSPERTGGGPGPGNGSGPH